MVHAQHNEEHNIKKERENKRTRMGSCSFAQPRSKSDNHSQYRKKFSVLAPSSASVPILKFKIVTIIGHQTLSLRVVSAVPEPIPFVRLVASTIKVCVEPVVMSVLDVASRVTKSEIVPSSVHKVSIVILQLSLIAQISRVPLLVLLVDNTQIDSMYFSLDNIKKVS